MLMLLLCDGRARCLQFIHSPTPTPLPTGMLIAGPAVAVVGAMGAGIMAASDKGDCGEVGGSAGLV